MPVPGKEIPTCTEVYSRYDTITFHIFVLAIIKGLSNPGKIFMGFRKTLI